MILTGFLLVALAVLGAPLFTVIAGSAFLGFFRSGVDLSAVLIEFYRLAEMPILTAIPLFTFAGYLLGESRAAMRLVGLSQALLGWLPGGLGLVAVSACAFFTALTGASGVTIVALGALLYPALSEAGYRENFSLGLVTTSGSLGLLFAPSLPLILYAVLVQQMSVGRVVSVDTMFRAGALPGLLMVALLSAWVLRERSAQPRSRLSWLEARAAIAAARWEIPLPVIVLGGIYGGIFAVSEAAVVTVFYVLIVEVLIHREVRLKDLPRIMRQSMVMVGGILIILGLSLASTNYLLDAEVPGRLFAIVKAHITDKFTFLIVLNIFLLVLGTMLDIFSALVIMLPLLLPMALGYGIDPVHFGIIFLANMQLGYITPPVGMSLFIASYRFEKPVMQLWRATVPFFLILLGAVLIITYWSALSLTLAGGS